MSYWTYVSGVVDVMPLGRSQAEKRYILDTVLAHLPKVTGSERDMNVYVIQKNGYNSSSSHDEFGQWSNLGNGRYDHSFETQDHYLIVVDGSFRDRMFEETYREFMKWLCRLAKRVMVEDVLVEVKGYDKSTVIRNTEIQRKKYSWHKVFDEMFEDPSWCNKDEEPNWCEFMMFDKAKNSDYPMLLGYKYFADEENDKEVERRIKYERGD